MRLLPEFGVDVDVVHALHYADVAAMAHGHVAVDTVQANSVRVVQLPPLADPGLLHQPAGYGHPLQLPDLWGTQQGQGSAQGCRQRQMADMARSMATEGSSQERKPQGRTGRAGQDGHTLPHAPHTTPSQDPVLPQSREGSQMQGAEVGKSCLALPVLMAEPSTHLLVVLLLRHGLHCLNRPLHELHQVLVEQLSGHLSAVGFGKDRVDTVLSTGTASGLQSKVQMLQSVAEGHSQPFRATL